MMLNNIKNKNNLKYLLLLILIIIIILILLIYLKLGGKKDIIQIKLQFPEIGLKVQDSSQIKYEVYPKDASNLITWTSSDSKIVSVNKITGYITSLKPGTVIIKAIANNKELASMKVYSSNNKIDLKDIQTEEVIYMRNNATHLIEINLIPKDANKIDLIYTTNDNIIDIQDGVIYSKEEGIAYINITNSSKTFTNTIKVIISNNINTNNGNNNSNNNNNNNNNNSNNNNNNNTPELILQNDNYVLKVGETKKISYVINPQDTIVEFSSSNPSVVSISSNVLTAKAVGTSIITCKAKGVVKTIKVSVLTNIVDVLSLEISGSSSVYVGKTIKMEALIKPENASDKSVNWSLDRNDLASITNDGVLTGIKPGTVKVICTVSSKITTKVINVLPIPVSKIEVSSNNISLNQGDTYYLNPIITPSDATNKNITYKSSNPSVASVNSGYIQAINPGIANITLTCDNVSISVIVLVKSKTFTNPLLNGADPYVMKYNNTYYLVFTSGSTSIDIYTSTNLYEFKYAKTVYTNDKVIWAPEIHFINNKFYIYYAKPKGTSNTTSYKQRMYVLESTSNNPLGEYKDLGEVSGMDDNYAIDGTVMNYNNNLYFLWSGTVNGSRTQNIYIAKMSSPTSISTKKVLISTPTYSFEKQGGNVNEAPQVLEKNGVVHIIYSASGANNQNYALGMLSLNGDPLIKSSWKKQTSPVFKSANDLYAPGHASFVKSPNGTEDWMIYHAYDSLNDIKNWNRKIRIQPFTWNNQTPIFGSPLPKSTNINIPK